MNARKPVLRLPALVAASLATLLGACTVGPDYVRPKAPTPAAYKEAANAQADAAPQIAPGWWEIYGDPALNALVVQVAPNNQSLAAAAARAREADALVREAAGPQYPSVGIGSIKSGRRNENDFGIGVSWEIDLWGRIRRDVEAHKAAAEASRDDLAAATLSLQGQLVQSYFALRQDDEVIALLEQTGTVSSQNRRMVENQYNQGQASHANVAEALMRDNTVQLQLAEVKSGRAQLEHAIAVMLGKPPADVTIAPAPFDAKVPVVPTGVPATLLERRPDVAASERRMAAANARIGVARAEQLPTISVDAGIGVRRGPTGTADVRAPLFTGGRLSGQVDAAGDAYSEAVANYQQTVLTAYREVEDGLVETQTLAGTTELQARAAAAAKESDRVMQNQYREGVADYPAVVDAANASLDARRSESQLRLRQLTASVNLIMALGGGWQPPATPTADASR